MKISKHIHSCLVVEDQEKVFLIDPGSYSFDYKGLDLNTVEKLDYILITHQHLDHMDIRFIKELLDKFPEARIISNKSVAEILIKEKYPVSVSGDSLVQTEPAPHERLFEGEPPENSIFIINNTLTHPGDSLHFNLTTPVLALPIQASWGSLTQAVDLALTLKPKIIIPIHDWHWNDVARDGVYARLESFFEKKGIKFISLQTNDEYEVSYD